MKKILSLSLILTFVAFAADKYGVYDIQGNNISTFEAEQNELRDKVKQIKNAYPHKKIYFSLLKEGEDYKPISIPPRQYRFKTGSYVEAGRKESFSLCPEKDTEGTWTSEYSVGLSEENCVIIQTPNLAGSFDVFFLKDSGFMDSIQVLVDQSYIQMGNYSHKIFVIDTVKVKEYAKVNFTFDVPPGAYESRSYNQNLIVDKTKFTMGDAQYYSKIDTNITFSPWRWDAYPDGENLDESKFPVIEVVGWRIANERSKKEGLDPAYIGFKINEFENGLMLDTSASGYRLPFDYEWYYLMRAGASTKYYWGDEEDSLTVSRYEWVRPTKLIDSKEGELKPVAQLLPNAFGLYDMLGIADENWESKKGSRCWGSSPECVFAEKIRPRYQYMGKSSEYCILLTDGKDGGCFKEEPKIETEQVNYNTFRLIRKTPKLQKLEKF